MSAEGFLTMTIIEASGKNKDDNFVWDSDNFEGFVKVELRGGPRNVKVSTRRAPVQGSTIFWNEPLVLEVLEHANELRVMLCKDKFTQLPDGSTKRGTQVLAACGIYVSDILDAVPIDKYFELFRPGAGGEGGFIRLGLDFSTDAPPPMPDGQPFGAPQTAGGGKAKRRRGWVLPVVLLLGAAAVGGGVLAAQLPKEQQQKDDGKGKPKAKK
ncbi:hypothetical protein MNEG_6139 [Monoraphidium neglectum]|uniref:C2 domain-containing protein n=1 Tax=Monoraphidium neglectum TaxID=145388 RepID=A0A0D2L3P0_9CHLO|nr:hypothetical protein MNEG_6139 [Monoraphidium neglectum]KIZ01819.1 hypothetical protein MNEG_6139 [Monoraphidium neglectum]|eukprot:XP_013900838.1 hypothetical protein MNEG_6139 [Monoraphidium neglectum]